MVFGLHQNIRTKSGLKFFRASLGAFGQKFFAPPTICLLLHLWSWAACVASESCRIFPRDQSVHLEHNSVEYRKIPITRSEKSKFYPELAKIRVNRGFLHFDKVAFDCIACLRYLEVFNLFLLILNCYFQSFSRIFCHCPFKKCWKQFAKRTIRIRQVF